MKTAGFTRSIQEVSSQWSTVIRQTGAKVN